MVLMTSPYPGGTCLNDRQSQLEVDYNAIPKEGASYPEIASRICQAYADSQHESFNQGVRRLKRAIASLTCWYPDREKGSRFGAYLDALSPTWVITTNYDLVVESLLTGKSIPLGPNDLLTNPAELCPSITFTALGPIQKRSLLPKKTTCLCSDQMSIGKSNLP